MYFCGTYKSMLKFPKTNHSSTLSAVTKSFDMYEVQSGVIDSLRFYLILGNRCDGLIGVQELFKKLLLVLTRISSKIIYVS